ncbi:MAG: hypothetical protein HQM12_06265 [SAR324 cluster bacterium]|nr:hypothetical protein [SAR324 cluster bacterium]MBF0351672.1 hypothetical protein [SAR324 cluster bacterium]
MFVEIRKIPGLSVVGKLPVGMERGGFFLNMEHILFVSFETRMINLYTDEIVFHLYFEEDAMSEYQRLKTLFTKKYCAK